MQKWIFLLLALLLQIDQMGAQERSSLALEEAYLLLEARYPLLQNGALLQSIFEQDQALLEKEKLPTFFLKADAQLQSENVSLQTDSPTPLPFEIDRPLYSLRTYAEGRYTILDGGISEAKSKVQSAKLAAEKQALEVDKYALRERLNQVFLAVLLLDEQKKLLDISLNDLAARKTQVQSAIEFGLTLESELKKLVVKELELQGQQSNLNYKQKGLHATLESLLDIELAENATLALPNLSDARILPELNRPEQLLFQRQQEAILAQSDMLDLWKKPRLGAFAQAGFGYPNPLNLLDTDFAPYALAGINFSWQLTDWKRSGMEREKLALEATKVQNAKETFEFNLNSKQKSYLAEVERLEAQMRQDEKIADLQAEILNQMAAQLDGGVITSTEYVTQVNEELRARQNVLIHKAELLQKQLEFYNERGL